jgi:intracellular septation protein
MRFLFDLFPILIFFGVYKWAGLYTATGAAMIMVVIQVVAARWWLGRVELLHWVNLGLILVFGGSTLLFRNPLFIQWKPTILQWILAVVFTASQYFGRKPVIQRLLERQITLTDTTHWRHLNRAWVFFFLFTGALNLAVAYHLDENAWVNFKLFGLVGLTFLFVFGQAWYLARHVELPEEGCTVDCASSATSVHNGQPVT